VVASALVSRLVLADSMTSVEIAAASVTAAEADDTSNVIGVLVFKDIVV
jgi:hypothetical protein